MGVREGVDPKRLEEAGWGVIFAHDADPAVKEALSELLALRREQAGDRFRLYEGADGYRPDEAKSQFLARHGAGPGPADPDKVPYYLLIVGSPQAIPYRFQSQLDVQYAVGRIHFDAPDEYASYVHSVVAAERGEVKLPRRLTFFGVSNPGDKATELSAKHLVTPLADKLQNHGEGWQVQKLVAADATKGRLRSLLGGDETPGLLVAASHGMSFPPGSPRQIPHQGALLCQDWPGPNQWHQSIPQDFYFAGDDLDGNRNLRGLLSIFYASYSAGTPRNDPFSSQAFQAFSEIAPHSFVARLPTAMLSRPGGGALAVIGHVERTWGYSFLWPGTGAQTTVFEMMIERLLDGFPAGNAMEYFNERYAELATVLNNELEEIEFGKNVDPYELAGMWTANNDARSIAVLGDPAVRLVVEEAVREPAEVDLDAILTSLRIEEGVAPSTTHPSLNLDLRLRRGEADTYTIELFLDYGSVMQADRSEAQFDFRVLEALTHDPPVYGEYLANALFADRRVHTLFVQTLDLLMRENRLLRLSLTIDQDAVELHHLRWEMLYDPERRNPLALSPNVIFSRFLTSAQWTAVELRQRRKLQVMVVISTPRGIDDYNVESGETLVESIGGALAGSDTQILSSRFGTEPASVENLVWRLENEACDILYLECHTAIVRSESYLWLENDVGGIDRISGSAFADMIARLRRPPLLVILGRGAQDALTGLALLISAHGVLSVLTLGDGMTINTASSFMTAFLNEIALHGAVDRAVATARRTVSMLHPDWGLPVLYQRVRDGRLWRSDERTDHNIEGRQDV